MISSNKNQRAKAKNNMKEINCNKFLKTKIESYITELIEVQAVEGNIFIFLKVEFEGLLDDYFDETLKNLLIEFSPTISSVFIFEDKNNTRFILIALKSIIGSNVELPSLLILYIIKNFSIWVKAHFFLDKKDFAKIIINKIIYGAKNEYNSNLIFSLLPNQIVLKIYDEIVIALIPEVKIQIVFFEQETWVSKFIPIYGNKEQYALLNLINFFLVKNDYIISDNCIVKINSKDIYMTVNNFILNLGSILFDLKSENQKQLSRFDLKKSLLLLDNKVLEDWFVENSKYLPHKITNVR